MLRIGLTGGIGSGKSYISDIFRHLGVKVFCADKIAREILDTNPDVKFKLSNLFGEAIYCKGQFDRKEAARKVFKDGDLLNKMNAIVHPAVLSSFDSWANAYSGLPYVLKEAAIIFETGGYKFLDAVINISAPEEIRINRVMVRDGTSREDVIARMSHQWKEKDRVDKADYLIVNDELSMLIPQVINVHNTLKFKSEIIR